MESELDINKLLQEAQSRWLKPLEVQFILLNHEKFEFTRKPQKKPPSGSLFLFNKNWNRFFRNDGHMWRKKRDGRAVGEAHERLKIGSVDTLHCYYAHGELNPYFQRRSYWLLDRAHEHIVLVHYLEVEGRHNSGLNMSTDSPSAVSQTSNFIVKQALSPGCSRTREPYQSLSSASVEEVTSEFLTRFNKIDSTESEEKPKTYVRSSQLEVNHELRKLAMQLSLDDDEGNYNNLIYADEKQSPYYTENDLSLLDNGEMKFSKDGFENLSCETKYGEHSNDSGRDDGEQDKFSYNVLPQGSDNQLGSLTQQLSDAIGNNAVPHGFEELTQYNPGYKHNSGECILPKKVGIEWTGSMNISVDNKLISADYSDMLFDEDKYLSSHGANSLTIMHNQLFSFREVTPEWAFSSQNSKVIIMGDFLCDPEEHSWAVMFGDIEVPLEFIQEGILCCWAPEHAPGRITLCITSGNRESCSEVREFEYFAKPETSSSRSNLPESNVARSTEELLLLVRFVQTLLCKHDDEVVQTEDNTGLETNLSRIPKERNEEWQELIESLLVGNVNPSDITDWLLQELLKDKLQRWLSQKSQEREGTDCSFSKQDQCIIHALSGVGYEWALNPVLSMGMGINFRDVRGWTALHWAAHFGREKMVASLLAAGASAGAITDPTSHDPVGKTPASIASMRGHKGLAGYLSEVALTTHLSSLRMEESEISKESAAVEAERTVESISDQTLPINAYESEDQLSLKDSLAAVRNAALAAARIQSAFRAHSFSKRQEMAAASCGEYNMTPEQIHRLLGATRYQRGSHGAHDQKLNVAALCIQKKFRGWKGREKFLSLRQNVVKIQALVRGHQVRKKCRLLWTVSIVEKAILRWRRRRVGFRGFRAEGEPINEIEEDDDLKVFRKQKVDGALGEALSRVLSMAKSPPARQQYRRVLESYHQAKDELYNMGEAASSFTQGTKNSDEDMYQLTLDDTWANLDLEDIVDLGTP